MKPEYKQSVVMENEEIAEGIYKLTVSNVHEKAYDEVRPGQFYMLRCWKDAPLLSRPISLNDIYEDKIIFLYAAFGKGTKAFSKLKKGDSLEILGPLGNGFDVEKIKGNVAIVTGGIGIAPMLKVAKDLRDCSVDFYAGFRSEVYCVEEMKEWTDNIYLSTENGSIGHKGYITEILKPEKYDVVLCCGPEVMMMKVADLCKEKKVPLYVSMEKHMACGVGACLVCTCKTKNGNKRTCKDGPVFSSEDLVF